MHLTTTAPEGVTADPVSFPTHPTATALASLEHFVQRVLPGLLRRLASWKGVPLHRHHDLIGDLRQELAVDCLEQPAAIVALAQADRHQRWFRLVERHLYRLRFRDDRYGGGDATLLQVADRPEAAPQDDPMPSLPAPTRSLLPGLLAASERHHNGRCNVTATAAALGVRSGAVRRLWRDLADTLGFDRDYLRFWCRRLAEAALGLAADLLRDSGALRIHGEPQRRRPDPAARRQRIARIVQSLHVRPLPPELRRHLRAIAAVADGGPEAVHGLLDAAEALAQDHREVHLWRFEACVLAGDWIGAANALRLARDCGAQAVPVLLARARLLEARGRERAALRLLSRGAQRHRGDGRIVAILRAMG